LHESVAQIRARAAQACGKYQKISLKAERNLLVTGWQRNVKIKLSICGKIISENK